VGERNFEGYNAVQVGGKEKLGFWIIFVYLFPCSGGEVREILGAGIHRSSKGERCIIITEKKTIKEPLKFSTKIIQRRKRIHRNHSQKKRPPSKSTEEDNNVKIGESSAILAFFSVNTIWGGDKKLHS